ncbi:alanine--tRNA ligase [Aquimonas voraii]|uniref:Alanine--tRNA ligase n=1 Tax=Aquimonas voraii TaxID=265719 RepID=A0A1G6RU02_9GAMM|nr:alanine--tRNA ligase [Aquimonas voraii]SDD08038.1 alanyl-tRNA synthetase [Aquimonas voraii]
MKTSNQIRQDFLDFFKSKGHAVVASSSLVPGNDPTLLFTNAGMVQFKDVFLGGEKRSYKRAVSSQRCVRAGGKHNDLDQVGYTARHHTFFEMLGNFSFGDYFKRDAIAYAWELLTEVWKLPKEKLLVTVYHTDDEAFAIWRDVAGVPEDRIIRIGDNKGAPYASDNFWQMADTGPCGPCTEIFYDHGAHIAGGPPGSPDEDGDRFIEIWNNVFMQFDRQPDGSLLPLPAPCVDTGMGLERIAAVLQHVHSNYEIDLFQALIRRAAELTATADLENKSLRVIADHIRACSFLIVDGVLPSNEGRGYVLRRIIRRALRHGWMLGVRGSFFHRMVAALVEQMGEAYPELREKQAMVEAALRAEEERFAETLDQGMRIFDEVAARSSGEIPGADAFRLYDTYGFPVDLTADMARERGMGVDMAGFEAAMEKQREQARAASKFASAGTLSADIVASLSPTEFVGYEDLESEQLKVIALLREGASVQALNEGEHGILILDRTPFYAESGGQVGDHGQLSAGGARFEVRDTQKLAGVFHGHVGHVSSGSLKVGDVLAARVDSARRQSTVLNHSATHLLHAALRSVLGTHVQQKGSLVAPDRLRFDFSHFQALSANELKTIEDMVNAEVRRNVAAEVHHMGMQEALDFGAMALFGEKYGDRVRVLRMGEFSTELCGGTHVQRTGDIGLFKILSEGGVAAGVRRIEAVTGEGALAHVREEEQRLGEIAELVGASKAEVGAKLRQLLDRQKQLEKTLEQMKAKSAANAASELADSAIDLGGFKLVAARLDGLDAKALRDSVDVLKNKLGDAVILLATGSEGKASLAAGVAGAALGKVKAGDVVSFVAAKINGKGGGRPDMAQGGGEDGPALAAALAEVEGFVRGKV